MKRQAFIICVTLIWLLRLTPLAAEVTTDTTARSMFSEAEREECRKADVAHFNKGPVGQTIVPLVTDRWIPLWLRSTWTNEFINLPPIPPSAPVGIRRIIVEQGSLFSQKPRVVLDYVTHQSWRAFNLDTTVTLITRQDIVVSHATQTDLFKADNAPGEMAMIMDLPALALEYRNEPLKIKVESALRPSDLVHGSDWWRQKQ